MHPLLEPDILTTAYANGIFPMADDDGEILWFCPDPRAVIELDRFHVSKTLRQLYKKQQFELTIDSDFAGVIRNCAERPEGTWISQDIVEAYTGLHHLGRAHSVEAWRDGMLVGGLYGVEVGGVFCGESMFHRQRDASKVALVHLVERMTQRGFCLLDVQFMTEHLKSFGAGLISREEYLRRLHESLDQPCRLTD
jgi:leucyl/phenylalanyl-tRNA--protein transferase